MAMVLMLVCTLMTAITIVRERLGTDGDYAVSPMQPFRSWWPKAVPLFIIVHRLSYKHPVAERVCAGCAYQWQPVLLLILEHFILYTLTCLAFGLLISTRPTHSKPPCSLR